MCIFQSEQLIKLRFCRKNNLADICLIYRSQSIGLSCVGRCQKYMPTLRSSWRLPCYRYGMIFHRSSLIRQSCHLERDFDCVLLQLVDILNTEFKPRGQLTFITTFWRKNCAKFDSIFTEYLGRTRMHVHLKKWTSNFKLLHLLNHTCFVILIKYTWYVAWILPVNAVNLVKKICPNSRGIFPRALFLVRLVAPMETEWCRFCRGLLIMQQ